jgi:hypothetical protein
MTISYDYDESRATKADDAASRIAEAGPYIGQFKKAYAIEAQSGAQGITFEFDSPGNGTTEFSLYTLSKDGEPIFGANMVNAIMFLLGVKKLTSETGKVEKYDPETKTREEQDGEVFPQLCNKPIGIVLQKELYTKANGSRDGVRFGLYGVFQPETKLMMSEIKEKKTSPVKLDRLLKGLKVKDSRKAEVAEPGQPSVGLGATGEY